jgi:hypothetical protein
MRLPQDDNAEGNNAGGTMPGGTMPGGTMLGRKCCGVTTSSGCNVVGDDVMIRMHNVVGLRHRPDAQRLWDYVTVRMHDVLGVNKFCAGRRICYVG